METDPLKSRTKPKTSDKAANPRKASVARLVQSTEPNIDDDAEDRARSGVQSLGRAFGILEDRTCACRAPSMPPARLSLSISDVKAAWPSARSQASPLKMKRSCLSTAQRCGAAVARVGRDDSTLTKTQPSTSMRPQQGDTSASAKG